MSSDFIKKQIGDIKNIIKNNIDILINETYRNKQNESSCLLEKGFIKINNQTYNKYETTYKEELKPYIHEKDYIDTIETINEFPTMARKQFYRYVKTVIGIHIGVLINILIKNYFHILNEKFENLGLVFKCEWIPRPIEKSNDKFIQQEITIFYPLQPPADIVIDINTVD
ncbi:hypothetical protein ACTA71_010856 [Dictyostelium dimigraforme]